LLVLAGGGPAKRRQEGYRTLRITHGVTKGLTMQNGNLSNIVQPRVLLVFEGALGFIDGDAVQEFNKLASRGQWFSAWNLWEVNDLMARKIWDVTKRQSVNVALCTYVSDNALAAVGLQEWADEARLPIGECLAVKPESLARELSYMPDVACVYDASYNTCAALGSKGKHLRNVNDFCRF